jgi:hypothetical protein
MTASAIRLPNRSGAGEPEQVALGSHVAIVGANGSGKTRLGIWIEQKHEKERVVHRISAQKALSIPEFAPLRNLEQAEKDWLLGTSQNYASVDRKVHDRWGGHPATFLLNDYEKLLSVLFAKSAERDRKHTEDTRRSEKYVPVPDAPIDLIIKTWGDIMPHREIRFSDGKVMVKSTDASEYHGKEMSDGERVVLYLIGQCLCTPENALIIVDEPELHLHRSLVDKLWNKVEELCQTKTIVYITHDLDFASSRADAVKIWIKSFSGNDAWVWTFVPNDEFLPESLVLEVIGSRKKILFCEGDAGSDDAAIYQLAFPTYHVISRGGCEKVIESAKALRSNPNLHHIDALGIIDSDYREQEEVSALLSHGIHTIPVAEIENIFCVESMLRIVAGHFQRDPDSTVNEVFQFIASAMNSEFEVQISSMAERRVQFLLGAFSKVSHNKAGLENGLTETLSRIDIDAIYAQCKAAYEAALASNKLDELLRVYNRKSIVDRISGILGLAKGEYKKLLIRMLKGPHQKTIVSALGTYLPPLP